MQDVLVIGGGVIGLSLAYELAGQGVAVAVLDQGQLGQEASWAGAGILPPGNLAQARTPEARLRAASHELWPLWSARLREETGIDNGYRKCGGLEVRLHGSPQALDDEARHWQQEGVHVEPLTSPQARAQAEPWLSPAVSAAFRWPDMGQVRNPRHLKALLAACQQRGVRLQPGTPVWGFSRSGDQITAVQTPAGTQSAAHFVICSGAWSRQLLLQAGCPQHDLRPLRGQMVLLNTGTPQLTHVLNVGPRYVVPRHDGRVLIGSTEEAVGFDKRTTAQAIHDLIAFGVELVPHLAEATLERVWAGLRPQSADGVPYLDRVPQTDNLYVAAGHFRAGLQLSPITAVLLTQTLLSRPTTIPLAPYRLGRTPHHSPPSSPHPSHHSSPISH